MVKWQKMTATATKTAARAVRDISVEPMVFLFMLATNIYQVVMQVGLYQVVCHQLFAHRLDVAVDCHRMGNTTVDGRKAEDVVQEQTASWNMALSMAYMVPALVADLFLGAWGDRHGRKDNFLLGQVGFMIAIFPLTIILTFQDTSLYILLGVNLIAGLTGFLTLVMISVFAYLADTVVDMNWRTVRISITSMLMNLAAILGQLIAGASSLSNAANIAICQALLAASTIYCLFRIRHVPPQIMHRLMLAEEKKRKALENGDSETAEKCPTNQELHQNELPPRTSSETVSQPVGEMTSNDAPSSGKSGCCARICLILTTVAGLSKEIYKTYTRPRDGHFRAYLLVAAGAFLMMSVSEMGLHSAILILYVQRSPLYWDQTMIGYYRSASSALQLICTAFGILFLKKLCRLTDVCVVIIALCFGMAECILMAFVSDAWMAYLASVVGGFVSLAIPCVQSFITKLVEPDEVGKFLTAFGIAANLAILVSSVLFTGIYRATVASFAGFVYLLGAVFLCVSISGMVWIQFDMHFKRQPANLPFSRRVFLCLFDEKEPSPSVVADASNGQNVDTLDVRL